MTDEANEQAQWGAIDELRGALSVVKERTAASERSIQSLEARIDRQRETILEARKQAHAEYEALMAKMDETNSQIAEARGGLRVGRWLVGLAGTLGLIKVGDWTGVWEGLIELLKGG